MKKYKLDEKEKQLLEEIGLTRGEIKVYLTLLKLGETTTGKIIEEAQISSGKIYEILEKLIKKSIHKQFPFNPPFSSGNWTLIAS